MSVLCKQNGCHILRVQETLGAGKNPVGIRGLSLVVEIRHPRQGIAFTLTTVKLCIKILII